MQRLHYTFFRNKNWGLGKTQKPRIILYHCIACCPAESTGLQLFAIDINIISHLDVFNRVKLQGIKKTTMCKTFVKVLTILYFCPDGDNIDATWTGRDTSLRMSRPFPTTRGFQSGIIVFNNDYLCLLELTTDSEK